MPAKVQDFLGEQPLFVTTLDKRMAKIYPSALWDKNEVVFSEIKDDPRAVEDVRLVANLYGGDAEMDASGRILIPAKLRELLQLQDKQISLLYSRGAFDIYDQAQLVARENRADENLERKVEFVISKGLA